MLGGRLTLVQYSVEGKVMSYARQYYMNIQFYKTYNDAC